MAKKAAKGAGAAAAKGARKRATRPGVSAAQAAGMRATFGVGARPAMDMAKLATSSIKVKSGGKSKA